MKKFLHITFFFAAFNVSGQSAFNAVRTALDNGSPFEEKSLDSLVKIKYCPDSIFYFKALLHIRANELKMALPLLEKLKENYPTFYLQHYAKALYFFQKKDYGRSVDQFNLVLQQDSNHVKSLYNRALIAGLLEDYASALEDLSSCIAIAPSSNLYYSRAYWNELSGNYQAAIRDYEQCIDLSEKLFDAYFGLANCYRYLKQADKACHAIERAQAAGSQIALDLQDNYCH